jgi:hypothetical protein
MIHATRAQRRELAKNNAKLPRHLVFVEREFWSEAMLGSRTLQTVMRSREFLVQIFKEPSGLRLSVNRTTLGDNGRWLENITWDDLQDLKRQAGYGDAYAVEVYPPDEDVVNVASMRHLWIMEKPLPIGWRKAA